MAISANNNRQSNAELLRLIAMFMIVMHHFAVHALFPEVLSDDVIGGFDSQIVKVTHCFYYIGVNLFVLISGYFGIKASWKGFIRLYLMLVFYLIIKYSLKLIFHSQIGDLVVSDINKYIYYSLFPFGNNPWWFINSYLLLFLISPLLNLAIANASKKTQLAILLVLTVSNIYFGFIKGIESNDGYSVILFVYLYVIGAFMSEIKSFSFVENRKKLFWVYLVSSILWGIMTYLNQFIHAPFWVGFSYNNIFVVVSSVSFFLFVMSFEFQSEFVNMIATSCLAVYLIQDGGIIKYRWLSEFSANHPGFPSLLLLLLASVSFFVLAIAFDRIRVSLCKSFDSKITHVSDNLSYVSQKLLEGINHRL